MKFRREHADECVDDIVQRERLAQSASLAAEMTFEKRVGQNDDMTWIGRGRIKTRSDSRPHAEKRKDIRGSTRAFDPFRLRSARKIEVRVLESADRFELCRLPDPLEEIRVGDWHSVSDGRAERRILFPNHDDAVWISERKRPEQDGIDHTEDGRIRANSQGEDGDNGERESRRSAQHAQTESEVRQENSHRLRVDSARLKNREPVYSALPNDAPEARIPGLAAKRARLDSDEAIFRPRLC